MLDAGVGLGLVPWRPTIGHRLKHQPEAGDSPEANLAEQCRCELRTVVHARMSRIAGETKMSQGGRAITKHPRNLSWHSGQHCFAPHFHDQLFLGVILHGECHFQSLGRSYVAQAGDVVVIPSFVPHSAHCDTHTQYRALYFDEHAFVGMLPNPCGGHAAWRANVSVIYDPKQARHLAIALQESQGSALREAVAKFMYGRSDIASPRPLLQDSTHQLRRMVAAAAQQQLPLSAVANQFGCSPSAFSRMFHQQVGMRAVFFRNQLRLLTAEDRLLTGLPISKVAADCGYADQAHLTREIKKFRGVTPGTYLSSYRECHLPPLMAVPADVRH